MEIKKIIILLIIEIFVTFLLFLFSDNSQYKQIGDTNFYLLPNEIGQESFLYHNGGKEGVFYPIYHKGFVHDVYWNKQYIIIKCNQKKVENWYIIRNIEDYNYSKFNIHHYLKDSDYKRALDSLLIDEIRMEHTNGTIPWSLHL